MRHKFIVWYHNVVVELREHLIGAIAKLRRSNMQAADIDCTSIGWVGAAEQDTESPSCSLVKLSEEC